MYMKSGEEVYNKVYLSPRLPQRAVLKPILHHKRQDSSNFDARTSVDRPSKESEAYGTKPVAIAISTEEPKNLGKTRIQGLPHSIQQDDIRRETVKKLIHQFETHPNHKSLMAD